MGWSGPTACGGLWGEAVGGFELGGVGAAAARPVVVVQMSPEVNGRAVHAVAAAQGDRAAAMGADGLRRGVGGGRDGLVGVGVVGGFLMVGFFCTPPPSGLVFKH
ncbi:MAG: hypothetical protein IPH82_29165 [Chloroflexi bacterium]|nr:hypothetical protein [Chloroflexota bacterium]